MWVPESEHDKIESLIYSNVSKDTVAFHEFNRMELKAACRRSNHSLSFPSSNLVELESSIFSCTYPWVC